MVVAKPAGLTSHDVVARARRWASTRKVGHAGTLDPMATGVLVLGVGKATRLLTYLVGADKEYTATIRLGQSTVTDDAEGEVTASPGAGHITETVVHSAMAGLRGQIEQVPSAVSAIKVDGKRSYARVRSGEAVELQARPVTIFEFEQLGELRRHTLPNAAGQAGTAGVEVVDLDVRVVCSSGTYIRALARDLGQQLSSAGHLTRLERTRVGAFHLQECLELPSREDLAENWEAPPLISVSEAAARILPVRQVSEAEARSLGYGQAIGGSGTSELLAARRPDGVVVAIVEDRGTQARPRLVLEPSN